MVSQISNCCQIVAKIRVMAKEKSPKSLSDSSLGDFSSGATGFELRSSRADTI